MNLLIKNFDNDLHYKLTVKAAQEKKPLRALIMELLKKGTARKEKP